MSKFNVGDTVQCSDKDSQWYQDGGVVTETTVGMARVNLQLSQRVVAFHDSQLSLLPSNTAKYGSHYIPILDNNSEPAKEPFRHTDLGTDLSGDELMESIRSICGR